MSHRHIALILAAACAIAVSPTAFAQSDMAAQSGGKAAGAPAHSHGNMSMTSKGPSVAYLVHHAYKEAVHGNESLAFKMNDMAVNHFDNVTLVLGSLDLDKDISDPKMRSQVSAILTKATQLEAAPSAQGAQQLVGQFATLIATMPAPQGGGGGQGLPLTPMTHLPGELVGMAASSAVDTQVEVAHRDFAGAKLHAQHTVALLQSALKSAQLNNLAQPQVKNIQTLHSQAQGVLAQVNARNANADQTAGNLVKQIGGFLPALAPVPGDKAGGGAGR